MNPDNILTIIRFASIIGVVSIGMTFVIIGGGIDLSVGSVMGLTSVVATLAAVQAAATASSWLLMVLVALAVGTAVGFINGIVIAYGNVVAFIATLAMLVASRGFAEILSGRRTQIVNEQGFLEFFRSNLIGVPVLIWIFVARRGAGLAPAEPHHVRPPHRRHRRQPRGGSPGRPQGQAAHDVPLRAVRA